MAHRWIASTALAALLAVSLAGCGGAAPKPSPAAGAASGPSGSSGTSGTSGSSPSAPAPAGAAAAPMKATLVLDWYPNGDHAGIYSARGEGYAKQAGLDLTVQVPADPSAALKEVAAGQAQFAVSYEPEVFLARARGIPVVAVAAMVQRPLDSIIALKSSGIARPSQLAGKTVGTDGLPNTIALLDTVLRHAGVDPARVKQVDVSEGNVPALLAHRVDAIIGAYWNWEAVQIALKGQPVNVMRLDRYGVPNYDELVFITSEKVLKSDPALVRAFVAAEMRGERFAMDHPRQAAKFVLAAGKGLTPALVDRSVQLLAPVWKDGAPRLGYMDPRQWQSFEAWMKAQGLIKKDVAVDSAMTDAYLPG